MSKCYTHTKQVPNHDPREKDKIDSIKGRKNLVVMVFINVKSYDCSIIDQSMSSEIYDHIHCFCYV